MLLPKLCPKQNPGSLILEREGGTAGTIYPLQSSWFSHCRITAQLETLGQHRSAIQTLSESRKLRTTGLPVPAVLQCGRKPHPSLPTAAIMLCRGQKQYMAISAKQRKTEHIHSREGGAWDGDRTTGGSLLPRETYSTLGCCMRKQEDTRAALMLLEWMS